MMIRAERQSVVRLVVPADAEWDDVRGLDQGQGVTDALHEPRRHSSDNRKSPGLYDETPRPDPVAPRPAPADRRVIGFQ